MEMAIDGTKKVVALEIHHELLSANATKPVRNVREDNAHCATFNVR